MEHRTTRKFWQHYDRLPAEIRVRADQQFLRLKTNLHHPSLSFKKTLERNGNEIWSVRVTLNYRALAVRREYGFLWFWIGDHDTYDLRLS
jgi:hypothetical protein